MKKLLLILSLCSNLSLGAWAQDAEALEGIMVPAFGQYDVYSTLAVGVGPGKQRDTYLNDLLYVGSSVNVCYNRNRLLESFWSSDHELEASYMRSEDRASQLTTTLTGRVRYKYAHTKYINRLGITLGPYVSMDAGFNYNLKMAGANNPATARATGNLGAEVMKGWSYKIKQHSSGLVVSVAVPLVGAAFVPEYGASYYETFYLDHTNKNVHFTSLHNQQDLDIKVMTSLPTALIPCWKKYTTRLNLGLKYHIETMDINDIVTRYSNFQFVIGWSWQYSPRYYH